MCESTRFASKFNFYSSHNANFVEVNCTEVNEYCNCTQDKCSDLPNTVCNPDTGTCECNEDRKYQLEDGECKKVSGECSKCPMVLLLLLSTFFHGIC